MVLSVQNKKIGLLGGSFNPAHEGHLYISQQALQLLELDEVWWLVSPQNPLKDAQGMAAFEDRFRKARKVAEKFPQIIVSDFEKEAGTSYTFDTLIALKDKFPENSFVWLMGADNLLQFPKWHRWRDIMELMPIAVLNRDNLKDKALKDTVAGEFSLKRVSDIKGLAGTKPPAWAFLDIQTHPLSATKIRHKGDGNISQ